MTTRPASHAGSWYSGDIGRLSAELDQYLAQVPLTVDSQPMPIPGARIIISPHAGYTYCADTAAWAYKALDLTKAKRIFLLGPSHTLHLPGCALTGHAKYATPLGDLVVDTETVNELQATGKFDTIPRHTDEQEHSLEQQCPYIYKMVSLHFNDPAQYPTIIPVMVGNTSADREKAYGKLFAPYLADPTSIFVVSSDFCHWGERFQYTYYIPNNPTSEVLRNGGGYSLRKRRDSNPTDPPIHKSIDKLDRSSMDAIEGGTHDEFLDNLKKTDNTVCGRHPIGVVMAAIEELKKAGKVPFGHGDFKFIQYSRSDDVVDIGGSSVSYASAYAVL
ncbi:Uncharacterized protein BP5553_10661 [Venustampulla echinocandica]|uniref:Uncharacterized protein n=1 Tax=Venustampulla echinocandica TaxID=2656787 RepID=A0A370T8P5_9HELO|nr:Uncharacterized protein BP5553_10661 [Venustampulla echinocandica]RDL29796.1 Uncharacterized protein BP5553_10661 [Venustampulla echinocandica]